MLLAYRYVIAFTVWAVIMLATGLHAHAESWVLKSWGEGDRWSLIYTEFRDGDKGCAMVYTPDGTFDDVVGGNGQRASESNWLFIGMTVHTKYIVVIAQNTSKPTGVPRGVTVIAVGEENFGGAFHSNGVLVAVPFNAPGSSNEIMIAMAKLSDETTIIVDAPADGNHEITAPAEGVAAHMGAFTDCLSKANNGNPLKPVKL